MSSWPQYLHMTQHSHMLCQHVIHALSAFMTQQVQHSLLQQHSLWHNFPESESFPAGESHYAQHGLRAHHWQAGADNKDTTGPLGS